MLCSMCTCMFSTYNMFCTYIYLCVHYTNVGRLHTTDAICTAVWTLSVERIRPISL